MIEARGLIKKCGDIVAVGGLTFNVQPGFSAFRHKVGGFYGSVPKFNPLGKGGPLDLAGWNLVGEQGPELVGLDGMVHYRSASRSMLSRAGGGRCGQRQHQRAVYGVDDLTSKVMAAAEKASRVRGRTYHIKTA